jgi:hypothetical protein
LRSCDGVSFASSEVFATHPRPFADFVESDFDLERVGEYPIRGFNDLIELFAYHG